MGIGEGRRDSTTMGGGEVLSGARGTSQLHVPTSSNSTTLSPIFPSTTRRPSIAHVPRPMSHVPRLSSRLPPADPHLSPSLDLARLLQRYHIQGFHRPFSEWPAELRCVRHAPSMDVLNQERISLPGGVEICWGLWAGFAAKRHQRPHQDHQRPPPSSSMLSTASFFILLCPHTTCIHGHADASLALLGLVCKLSPSGFGPVPYMVASIPSHNGPTGF